MWGRSKRHPAFARDYFIPTLFFNGHFLRRAIAVVPIASATFCSGCQIHCGQHEPERLLQQKVSLIAFPGRTAPGYDGNFSLRRTHVQFPSMLDYHHHYSRRVPVFRTIPIIVVPDPHLLHGNVQMFAGKEHSFPQLLFPNLASRANRETHA